MGTPLRQHCVLPPPPRGEEDVMPMAGPRPPSGGELGNGPSSGFGDDGVFIVAQGA